jgi:hypothetical protein
MNKFFAITVACVLFGSAVVGRAQQLTATASGYDDWYVGVKYTSNNFTEFLWGLSRPVHLWNTKANGKKEILPFWTAPLKEGGFLSWMNPGAWWRNPSLTGGTLLSEAAIVAVAVGVGGGGGGSDTPATQPAAPVTPSTSSSGSHGSSHSRHDSSSSSSSSSTPAPSGGG